MQTLPFEIGDNIWRDSIRKAINFFYCERCGTRIPGIHGVCHRDWQAAHGGRSIFINGGWHDDQQLCVTQEGHMPLLSPWTTVTEWTKRSGGYLWWVNADQADTIVNLVAWAKSKGFLGNGVKFGVVAATRTGDTLALNNYLLPALTRAGLKPTHVQTIHFDTQSTAQANAEATVAVQQFRQDGDTVVLPLLPYNTMQTFLRAAQEIEALVQS